MAGVRTMPTEVRTGPEVADDAAVAHREAALRAMDNAEPLRAVVEALLSIESRLDELGWFLAQAR